MNTVERFKEITEEMQELCKRKNSDYGASVNDTYQKYGMTAYLVRLEDKLNRARNLALKGNQEVEDERLRDTLIDMANYCILAIIDLENGGL
jgi:arginine utilization protein RocB